MGKKGEATKQHIRMSAYTLFSEFGYTKVTMQDICTKSGLSKGGLYRHYEDKFEIFADILMMLQSEEDNREKNCMMEEISATETLEGYLQHIRHDLDKSVPNINIALYEFCIENKNGAGTELLSKQFDRGSQILLSLIEYGVSKGEFHVACPSRAVATILFLIEGLRMSNEVMEIPSDIIEDIFIQIKEMVGIVNEKK